MKNFKSGHGSDRDGGGNYRGRGFGNRDGGRPAMHKAICADCGNTCEVPFKPSGDKPVYCDNCFKGKESGDYRKSGGKNFGRSNFAGKKMFTAVCDQCGQSCEVPFKPSGDKPIYCKQCFGNKSSQSKSNNNKQLSEQLDVLNAKLDKVLKILTPATATKSIVKDDTAKKTIKLKPKKGVKKIATKKKS